MRSLEKHARRYIPVAFWEANVTVWASHRNRKRTGEHGASARYLGPNLCCRRRIRVARADGGRRSKTREANGVIAALVARARDRFALRRDLSALGDVRFPRDAGALLRLVRDSVVRIVIAEPRDPRKHETAPVIRAIKAAYPSIPILVLCDLTADDVHLLVDLVRSGADDAIVRSVDRVSGVAASLLTRGTERQVLVRALEEMSEFTSADARSIVTYSIEHPAARRPVEQVAEALGVSRRTLVNRLSAVGMPGPSVFVAWGRLLVAAQALEEPATSVRDVARTLGLRSSAGLHVLCRRHSSLSVRELRRGGPKAVLDLIRRELQSTQRRAARSASPVRPRRRHIG